MPVQKNPAFHFPAAWPECRYIGSGFLREKAVHHFMIQDKLKKHQQHGTKAKDGTEPGNNEKEAAAEEIQNR